jgi:hypothetical protein
MHRVTPVCLLLMMELAVAAPAGAKEPPRRDPFAERQRRDRIRSEEFRRFLRSERPCSTPYCDLPKGERKFFQKCPIGGMGRFCSVTRNSCPVCSSQPA